MSCGNSQSAVSRTFFGTQATSFFGTGAPHRFVHQLPEHQATHLATRRNEDHTEHGVVLLPLAKEVRPALQQASVTCSPRLPLLQAVDIHGLPTLLTKPHPPWHRARWQDDCITCTKRNHLEAGPPVTALLGIRYGGILPRPARRSSTTLGLTVVGPVSRRLGGSESSRTEGAGILLDKRKLRHCGTLPSLGERCRLLPVGTQPVSSCGTLTILRRCVLTHNRIGLFCALCALSPCSPPGSP